MPGQMKYSECAVVSFNANLLLKTEKYLMVFINVILYHKFTVSLFYFCCYYSRTGTLAFKSFLKNSFYGTFMIFCEVSIWV